MPLPALQAPSGLPLFLLAGHGISPDSLHDDIDVLQGEGRKRKVQTYAPRVVQVSWFLSEEQAAIADAWFENSLVVLHEPFTARIAPLGTDSGIYWAAQWIEPPTWEALHLGRWRVTGQLLLTGEGSDTAPGPVELAIEYEFALNGSAVVLVPADLAIEYEFALQSITPIEIEYEFALEVDVPSFELREDDGFELREDGGKERRE